MNARRYPPLNDDLSSHIQGLLAQDRSPVVLLFTFVSLMDCSMRFLFPAKSSWRLGAVTAATVTEDMFSLE